MRYKVHIQDKGWSVFFEEGRFAGTVGESKRIEAIVIEGVDEYRVHVVHIVLVIHLLLKLKVGSSVHFNSC